VAVVLVMSAGGCNGAGPTTATGASVPREVFEVTGVVTDDLGVPLAGAYVTMRNVANPSVVTDASGGYTIRFMSNPWPIGMTGQRGAARAEILADGYDEYWRTVVATSSHLVENFRLHRLTRMTAGDSVALQVTPDNGECHGWLYGPCGRVRIAVTATGNLKVEAVPTQEGAVLPQLEVCCVAGNEQSGNPITLPVTVGTELRLEVGQPRGFLTSESVLVKTSFNP
jgi:hypothetical protein